MDNDFNRLFSAAHERWVLEDSNTSNAPHMNFATEIGKSPRGVEHWCKGPTVPPKTKWPKVLITLQKKGNTSAEIAELDRAWRAKRRLQLDVDRGPAASGHGQGLNPAPWVPHDDHYRRIDGFADIDVHPPAGETAQGVFALRVSATLGTYETAVPDAPDGQQGFQVSLSLTGRIEIVVTAKGGVQRVPGSEEIALGAEGSPKISFAGGAWTLDVSQATDPATLLTNVHICDMRRYEKGGQVEVDLRCLPSAINVAGIPDGIPSTAQAVLRRLHQFADANTTEHDRIVLAWSRIFRQDL
jgi:hypothetical protein